MKTEETRESFLDRPEISRFIFYPRRDPPPAKDITTYAVKVGERGSVVCRFYPAAEGSATILYFHGNGETAGDYDLVSSLYTAREINLFVADYRGYGLSTGEPSFRYLFQDAHPIFTRLKDIICEHGSREALFVMGRSLGSAPAIEVALHYQDTLKGLIVESGFSDGTRLLNYLGLPVEMVTGDEEYPNGSKMRSIHLPALFIHAADDHLIPLQEAERLYDLCPSKEKQMVVIPGAGHNTLMMVGRDRYFQAIQEFIQRHA